MFDLKLPTVSLTPHPQRSRAILTCTWTLLLTNCVKVLSVHTFAKDDSHPRYDKCNDENSGRNERVKESHLYTCIIYIRLRTLNVR